MRALIAILICTFVAACGVEMKPGTKSHARRDIPPGPGVLSGEDGEFVLFRIEDDPPQKQEAADKNPGQAGEADTR